MSLSLLWQPLVGGLLVALGAQITVPMAPVPMTLQTLAVLACGLVLGPRRGAAAVALYVLAVGLGLPVLADGSAAPGWSLFTEPTAGYVLAFVPAAALAGWIGRPREAVRDHLLGAVAGGLAGHALVLVLGMIGLLRWLEPAEAWSSGAAPFLTGAVAKSVLAAAVAVAARRGIQAIDEA